MNPPKDPHLLKRRNSLNLDNIYLFRENIRESYRISEKSIYSFFWDKQVQMAWRFHCTKIFLFYKRSLKNIRRVVVGLQFKKTDYQLLQNRYYLYYSCCYSFVFIVMIIIVVITVIGNVAITFGY